MIHSVIFVVALVISCIKTFTAKLLLLFFKKDMMFIMRDNYEWRKPSPMKYEKRILIISFITDSSFFAFNAEKK